MTDSTLGPGDKVKVLECHAMPELVGQIGVVSYIDGHKKWPVKVKVAGATRAFRPPELEKLGGGDGEEAEAIQTKVPEVFAKELPKEEVIPNEVSTPV